MAVSAFAEIVRNQLAWARRRNLSPSPDAYLSTYTENLFAPLSSPTEKDFRGGAGCELDDHLDERAKMRALFSSSGLVCNVFDYWRNTDSGSIGRSLAIESALTEIRFEAQLSSGLRGTPPTLDLLLVAGAELAFGVECKFAEPYYQRRHERIPFVDTYFKGKPGLWELLGLPKCQETAARLYRGDIKFERLDAAQLLKHSLGLRRKFKEGQLILVWFNFKSVEAQTLSAEIRSFSELVDPCLGFRAVTWQEVFADLAREPLADRRHVEYLRSRYFPE